MGLVLLLSIPVTMSLVFQQQDIRQRASETIAPVVVTATSTGIYCFNYSGSTIQASSFETTLPSGVTVLSQMKFPAGNFVAWSRGFPIAVPFSISTGDLLCVQAPVGTNVGLSMLRSDTINIAPPGATPGSDGYIEANSIPSGITTFTVVDGTTTWKIWPDNGYLYKMRQGGTTAPTATPTPTPSPTPTTVPTATPTPTPTTGPSATPRPIASPTAVITPVTTPGAGANISLSLKLPGIGSGSGESGSNSTPKQPTRTATVALFDSVGRPIPTPATGAVSYANGVYTGLIPMGTLAAGSYEAKIKFDNTLWKRIPGFLTVSSGTQTLTTPTLDLIPGDISGTNTIDLTDYNAVISCYKGTCGADVKALADLNDDGVVDAKDLNILLRAFAARQGD